LKIFEDKGNKESKHVLKNKYFAKNNIDVTRVPLPVGDYALSNDKMEDVIKRKTARGLDLKKMDFVGCYDVCVDTKEHIQELIGNICGKQHARFRDELILAQNNGINLIVLVENKDGVETIDDLFKWRNPRLDMMKNTTQVIGRYKTGRAKYAQVRRYPGATRGSSLAKSLYTMQAKYGCTFMFCSPQKSGEVVIELLTQDTQGV